ncbi:pyridoxal-phosphate-dependent aminotransferase family protein [Acetomicrobium sp. UBA5826]|uniref:pyridoxal-phosphate-dependent aminotransferase family protein n=1 Tax=Acetomicrobium sp. UBA5826 TaxID=1946039 RepID=UPI00257A9A8F|nr:alanine--glyoxylate aminotransferase family protein [Acetomicrobium sp. UBA5826]
MKTYPIGLVPGPVSVPKDIREVYTVDFGSADLEDDFFELYRKAADLMKNILSTKGDAVIMSGEGMLALWGALKSVVSPGKRVLAVSNGIFGEGIAQMARSLGCEVREVSFDYDSIPDPEVIRKEALTFRPFIITAVHCETPSGVLNPVKPIGEIAEEVGALFYVDFVSSACGTEVLVDDWHIDLGLLGSQKALSLPPDLAIVTVSEKAWDAIAARNYEGYDALLPWRDGPGKKELPYTHNWHAVAALFKAADKLLREGLENVYKRHEDVKNYCLKRLKNMGLKVFAGEERYSSPTVTAVCVPENRNWEILNSSLRERGVVLGGSYGPLKGRLFRIGHMGSQADKELVGKALDVLQEILNN